MYIYTDTLITIDTSTHTFGEMTLTSSVLEE